MNQLHVVEADSWCIRNISYAYMLCLLFDVRSFYAVSEFFTHEYICCCWVILHSMAYVSYILNFIQFKEELFLKWIICFDRNDRGRSHAVFEDLTSIILHISNGLQTTCVNICWSLAKKKRKKPKRVFIQFLVPVSTMDTEFCVRTQKLNLLLILELPWTIS